MESRWGLELCGRVGVPEERTGRTIGKGAASVAVETLAYWECQDCGMTVNSGSCIVVLA